VVAAPAARPVVAEAAAPAGAVAAHAGHGAATAASAPGWALAVLLVVAVVVPYLAGAARVRARGRRWSRWRTASWTTGALLLGAAASPPVAAASAGPLGHTAQHLLLGMHAPLALVLASPVRLLLGAGSPAVRRRVAAVLRSRLVRVASVPAVAALVDTGGLYLLHLTPLLAASHRLPWVHALVVVHFVLAGSLWAWAVAGPDPAPHRPGTGERAVVLVLAAAAHGVLAKLLYARAADLPPGAPGTVAEREQAAVLLSYGGDLAEVLLAAALFAGWLRLRGVRARTRMGACAPGPSPTPLRSSPPAP